MIEIWLNENQNLYAEEHLTKLLADESASRICCSIYMKLKVVPRNKLWVLLKFAILYRIIIVTDGSNLTVAAPGFWFEGTSENISYMNSTQVLYCNGVAKNFGSGGGIFRKMDSSKTFEKFWKCYKKICTKI